ncbi:MAG: NDNF family protein [Candidatus Cloacimonetes bacterium]|nr:NDNF family protein [Candidatus Cloacimonadota bacterium]
MIDHVLKKRCLRTALLFCCLLILIPIFALSERDLTTDEESEFIVRNLIVEDIPDDDGSGLMLSWEPLGIDRRIIEYRVYRGAAPDSLFYIGNIPINPRTGFPGDRVYYYDSGYTMFVSITSPARLRQEVQQPAGSPLFREIPRDLTITGPKLERYDILAVIPKKQFYYHAEKITIEEEDEDGEITTDYYAGLRLRQYQYLLKKLKPDTPYYYTVVAVNEQRRFSPYAPIVEGIPRRNRPEQTRDFYAVFIQDIERLQFEWSLPLNPDIIRFYNVYLLHQNDLQAFNNYNDEIRRLDENRLARLDDSDISVIEPTLSNPGQLLYRRQTATPYTSMNTGFIDIEDGIVSDPDHNIDLSINSANIDQYYAVFSLLDWYGGETFTQPVKFLTIVENDLPSPPDFTIIDKPNDQGDYNLVYWDKPVVFLTNSSVLNQERTRLTINYEFETNKNYKVRSIYFDIYDDEDEPITTINEFYQNLRFNITLPDKYSIDSPEYDENRRIKFRMHFKVSGNELSDDYVFYQEMAFDSEYLTYRPRELYLGNEKVHDYSYLVYKKPYSGEIFRQSARAAGVVREIDDNIRYEASIFKGTPRYYPEKNLLLVDTRMNAFYDKEEKRTVFTNIFLSVVEKNIDNYQAEIEKYTELLEAAETDDERAQHQMYIDHYQNLLAANDYEFIQEANSKPNDRVRMKFITERREGELRTFQYKIVKTDGSARFVETDVYEDEDGNVYFFPEPNWFNNERLPTLIASLLFGLLVFFMVKRAKQGHDMYIRPIAGIQEIDNAIGRATEMGRPILFQPGLSGIGDVATLAGLAILGRVATKAAEYDTRILVPVRDYIVLPIAQEIVKEAHHEAGRPDTYDKSSVFFITTDQFAFVAGVNGVMVREKCATCFYMGMFFAEALIMTETGNSIGAVQIAGSDAVTQIPFFITTCDYTLIGEELYGASAYLSREPLMMGTLKAVDVTKFLILLGIVIGTILSTSHLTFFINIFPDK